MTPETWEAARPLLEKAVKMGLQTHDISDVKKALDDGLMQLWCHNGSVLVTEVLSFPRLRVCSAKYAGGRMKDCFEMKPAIERWAKDNGCDVCEVYGRRGWQRVHKDYRLGAGALWKEI